MKTILFLSSGNACRSNMARAILTHLAGERYLAYSAGSFPTGTVHPLTLQTLKAKNIPVMALRSKSWDEFHYNPVDIIITVCDRQAIAALPLFPGKPIRAHWSIPDASKFVGSESERQAEFLRVYDLIEHHVKALLRLPIEQMLPAEITAKINEIGLLYPQAA